MRDHPAPEALSRKGTLPKTTNIAVTNVTSKPQLIACRILVRRDSTQVEIMLFAEESMSPDSNTGLFRVGLPKPQEIASAVMDTHHELERRLGNFNDLTKPGLSIEQHFLVRDSLEMQIWGGLDHFLRQLRNVSTEFKGRVSDKEFEKSLDMVFDEKSFSMTKFLLRDRRSHSLTSLASVVYDQKRSGFPQERTRLGKWMWKLDWLMLWDIELLGTEKARQYQIQAGDLLIVFFEKIYGPWVQVLHVAFSERTRRKDQS